MTYFEMFSLIVCVMVLTTCLLAEACRHYRIGSVKTERAVYTFIDVATVAICIIAALAIGAFASGL